MRKLFLVLFLLMFSTEKSKADLDTYLSCIQYGYDMAVTASASASLISYPGPPFGVAFQFCNGSGCWMPGLYCMLAADPGSDGGSSSSLAPRGGGGNCSKGSIIDPILRSVGESISVVGTPFSLMYFSNRGRRSYEYEISTNVCQTDRATGSLPDCRITYDIAGQSTSNSFIAASTATYDYTWNSLDNSSAKIFFSRPVVVTYEMLNLPSPLDNAAFPLVRERTLGTYDSNFYGLGGWGIDQLHAYDTQGKILYYGYGATEYVDGISSGGGNWLVKAPGGQEVYEFSSDGHHLSTKTGLLGATIYTFTYNGSGHLTQISDAYGNDTVINRNGSGFLTGITGPYGQFTDIDLNGDGYIESVTDPNSKTTNIPTRTQMV
jgi:YD repeat-containing protein